MDPVALAGNEVLSFIWEKALLAGGEAYSEKLCVLDGRGLDFPNPMGATVRVSNGRGATLKFPVEFVVEK